MELSACRKGRIGEYLVASVIESLGWDCIFTPSDHFDLVAGTADRFMRIQVKSSSRSQQKPRSSPCYYYSCATGSATKIKLNPAYVDVVAFVALDKRSVYFRSVKDVKSITLRLYDKDFSKDIEIDSWTQAIETVTGKKWNVE